jgi:uncharacterized repeat protein (TIGR01451 family)
VGDRTHWRLQVTNAGPATATGVEVRYSAKGGSIAPGARLARVGCGRGGCGLGTLAPQAMRTIALTVRPARAGTLTVSGTVHGHEAETRSDNNTDRAAIRVRVGGTSVSLTKVALRDAVPAGATVPFLITVRTTGRRDAHGVVVCDRPSQGLHLIAARGARIRHNTACWRIARLQVDAGRRLTVTARADVPAAALRRAVNRATVRGANLRSRRAAASVFVVPRPPQACATDASPIAHQTC